MGQDKKQLNKLLDFVSELYKDPGNKEFAAGIRSLVMNDKDFLRSGSLDGLSDISDGTGNPLLRIEKYLSLDYDIDFREFPDYSFVTDGSVKERLEADFREMMRYRFGTRSHRVDFPEFCRFATLQFEMLVNYYYERRYGSDVTELIRILDGRFEAFHPADYMKSVSSIPFRSKVFELLYEFAWESWKSSIILHCYDLRNKQSHRSLIADRDIIAECERRLKERGYWSNSMNAPIHKDRIVDDGVLTKNQWDSYQFQVWYDSQPFELVTAVIGQLSSAISSSIARP